MHSKALALRSYPLTIAALLIAALAVLLVPTPATAASTASVSSPFVFQFNTSGTVKETGSMSESSSPYFWLNSGGKFILEGGIAKTIHGALPLSDLWRILYATTNALDTDDGAHPQNIFRLLTRSQWGNATMSIGFKIDDLILSDTPNRDGYSGVLLMSRYKDGDNLYYAGIRHDGEAIIKKKRNGTYTTLAAKQIFGSAGDYDKYDNPNLIPEGDWMRMKVETANMKDGSVLVSLYLDKENDGSYAKILSAKDSSNAHTGKGYSGVRTDYMDVSFDNLRIENL